MYNEHEMKNFLSVADIVCILIGAAIIGWNFGISNGIAALLIAQACRPMYE